MLTKHTGIEIPPEEPFVNDKLERKTIAENLTKLVQSTNQPFVISIEAPWGWGKTTFIQMWKYYLENHGHTCLYFNAWENDFVDDPLIAFIGEIGKAINDKQTRGNAGKQLKKLQTIGGKIVRHALPLTIQIATHGLLSHDSVEGVSKIISTSGDEIADFASELAAEKIKQYDNDKNGIEEFKKELAKFAKSISEGKDKKPPLVFFIDELDRCRPDFSIFLLERVKHIFNVNGIVFILGIDRDQIEQSVRSLYGQEMKEDGYLRRFIDFRVQLPQPTTHALCNLLYQKFNMDEIFNKQENASRVGEVFIESFLRLANAYEFSPRVIEQCFTEMNFVLRTTPTHLILYPSLVAFLVAYKAQNSKAFSLLKSHIEYENIKKIILDLKNKLDSTDSLVSWLLIDIEAYLILSCMTPEEANKIHKKFVDIVNNNDSNDVESKHASQTLETMREFSKRRNNLFIQQLLSRLEIAEKITVENN